MRHRWPAFTVISLALVLLVGAPASSDSPDQNPLTGAVPMTIDTIDLRNGHFAQVDHELDLPQRPKESGGDMSQATSRVITAGKCHYTQRTDDPGHRRGQVRVHGWWAKDRGTCPDKATTTIVLEAYWCDRWGCRYVTVASGKKTAASGTSRRGLAAVNCAHEASVVSYRARVDVDLVGVVDPAGWTFTPTVDFSCYPVR